jgi:hypothetical protein
VTDPARQRGTPSRAGLRAVIPRRHKVGPWTTLLLALAFPFRAGRLAFDSHWTMAYTPMLTGKPMTLSKGVGVNESLNFYYLWFFCDCFHPEPPRRPTLPRLRAKSCAVWGRSRATSGSSR